MHTQTNTNTHVEIYFLFGFLFALGKVNIPEIKYLNRTDPD